MAKNLGPIVEESTTGYRMHEATARIIADLSKGLPKECRYHRQSHAVKEYEISEGERTDLSYITTDCVDRENEVVLPAGMDKTDYDGVVTLGHDYKTPFGAACLWIKTVPGKIVAKTKYQTKPPDWGDGTPWMPSAVLHMMQQDPPACTGKSIGLIPTRVRSATKEEKSVRPEWDGKPIIEQWKLLEYACTPVPANQHSTLISVSKGMDAKAVEAINAVAVRMGFAAQTVETIVAVELKSFVTPETIRKAIEQKQAQRRAAFAAELRAQVADEIHRLRGTP